MLIRAKRALWVIMAFAVATVVAWALSSSLRHEMAANNIRDNIPEVRQFHALFPQTYENLSHYTGSFGDPVWTSKIGLHGRYILSLQVPLMLNWTRTDVRSYGRPRFQLVEVTRIYVRNSGQLTIDYGVSRHFGAYEWKEIVNLEGDISALGIMIKKNQAIRGFQKHWRGG